MTSKREFTDIKDYVVGHLPPSSGNDFIGMLTDFEHHLSRVSGMTVLSVAHTDYGDPMICAICRKAGGIEVQESVAAEIERTWISALSYRGSEAHYGEWQGNDYLLECLTWIGRVLFTRDKQIEPIEGYYVSARIVLNSG